MELHNLLLRFSNEFEIDFPENAEETMPAVKDVRDYVRHKIASQGIECSSGMVFDRMRALMAIVLRLDASTIRPETRFADVL